MCMDEQHEKFVKDMLESSKVKRESAKPYVNTIEPEKSDEPEVFKPLKDVDIESVENLTSEIMEKIQKRK
jgi:hypothetical protein